MTLTVSVIIVWLLIGLVIGALARLLVPGRQHIGIIMTILIGIVAALVGGVVTTAILGAGHTVITFIVALVAAALLVSAFTTRGYGRYRSRRRPGVAGKYPLASYATDPPGRPSPGGSSRFSRGAEPARRRHPDGDNKAGRLHPARSGRTRGRDPHRQRAHRRPQVARGYGDCRGQGAMGGREALA